MYVDVQYSSMLTIYIFIGCIHHLCRSQFGSRYHDLISNGPLSMYVTHKTFSKLLMWIILEDCIMLSAIWFWIHILFCMYAYRLVLFVCSRWLSTILLQGRMYEYVGKIMSFRSGYISKQPYPVFSFSK
jgi:hypothetical protein